MDNNDDESFDLQLDRQSKDIRNEIRSFLSPSDPMLNELLDWQTFVSQNSLCPGAKLTIETIVDRNYFAHLSFYLRNHQVGEITCIQLINTPRLLHRLLSHSSNYVKNHFRVMKALIPKFRRSGDISNFRETFLLAFNNVIDHFGGQSSSGYVKIAVELAETLFRQNVTFVIDLLLRFGSTDVQQVFINILNDTNGLEWISLSMLQKLLEAKPKTKILGRLYQTARQRERRDIELYLAELLDMKALDAPSRLMYATKFFSAYRRRDLQSVLDLYSEIYNNRDLDDILDIKFYASQAIKASIYASDPFGLELLKIFDVGPLYESEVVDIAIEQNDFVLLKSLGCKAFDNWRRIHSTLPIPEIAIAVFGHSLLSQATQ